MYVLKANRISCECGAGDERDEARFKKLFALRGRTEAEGE